MLPANSNLQATFLDDLWKTSNSRRQRAETQFPQFPSLPFSFLFLLIRLFSLSLLSLSLSLAPLSPASLFQKVNSFHKTSSNECDVKGEEREKKTHAPNYCKHENIISLAKNVANVYWLAVEALLSSFVGLPGAHPRRMQHTLQLLVVAVQSLVVAVVGCFIRREMLPSFFFVASTKLGNRSHISERESERCRGSLN